MFKLLVQKCSSYRLLARSHWSSVRKGIEEFSGRERLMSCLVDISFDVSGLVGALSSCTTGVLAKIG